MEQMPKAMNIDRTTPAYTEAITKKKSQNDPRETAIREKIAAIVLREPSSRDAFERVREMQQTYLKDAIAHADDAMYIHELTQNVLKEISSTVRSQIEEGAEHLSRLPAGTPVLVMTNHF